MRMSNSVVTVDLLFLYFSPLRTDTILTGHILFIMELVPCFYFIENFLKLMWLLVYRADVIL